MWKEVFALDKIQKPTWKRDLRGEACRSGVPCSLIIFFATSPVLFCFAFPIFCSPAYLYNPFLSDPSQELQKPGSLPSVLYPVLSIYFFSRVQYSFFPQGTVRGEKDSIPGDQPPCNSTASSLLWNFVYKLALRSTIHLCLPSPSSPSSSLRLRSWSETSWNKIRNRSKKGSNSFGVTHNWLVRVRGSG